MLKFLKAQRLNAHAGRLAAKGWIAEAEVAYRAAAAARPGWSVPWYNLGLMHKYRHNWEPSFEGNQRAAELAPTDEAGWWNLGIAATALGRWDVARRAWQQCDIAVPPGEGPIEMDMGHVPIRLTENNDGEVVWSRRIDPARAILISVPLPGSGHRWGDLVLHDGAPNGHRLLGGQKVPVFDELVCLRRATSVTFIAELAAEASAMETLASVADELGGAAEDWSTSTRRLCQACSEGTVGHVHDADRNSPAHPHCGIAARDQAHAQEILDAWLVRAPGGRVLAVRPADP